MAGAKMAEPGEFTKRAFLSGRIDLSEAEAVMDLIQAEKPVFDAGVDQTASWLCRRESEEPACGAFI